MYGGASQRREDVLLRTRLSPPQLRRRVLERPALTAHLLEAADYRLTIVQAGTGYSKTTALASLDGDPDAPIFWYSLGEADADPQRFLSYLTGAFRVRLPALSDLPLAVLQERAGEGSREAWATGLDALLNALSDALPALPGPSLLVLDDYHFVARSPEIVALVERFVDYLPPDLHVIISTRYPPAFDRLVTWRARGEVMEVGRSALAFQPAEVEALFRDTYRVALSPGELDLLVEKTEGWPIALQLVWQGLRNGAARSVGDLLRAGSNSLGTLFEYLARDVLGAQPPEIAAFLRDTAILRELTPPACDAVTGRPGSDALLDRLLELDLFVVALGESHYRYHHLFHDFLRQQPVVAGPTDRDRHRRAAAYFEEMGEYEEAIYHWLAAHDLSRVASCIEQAGEDALRSGWLDTVATWVDALPPEVLADHPLLQAFMGDIYRMRSRFDESLAWYAQAERVWRVRHDDAGVSRSLRGQALVYLDTVRPAQAQSYLEEALRLIEGLPDRETRARLLELLAENKLNMGKPDEAERLRADARSLREEGPGEDALSVRVKLRTGRFDDAQRTLESWAEAERQATQLGQTHPPRAHRETLLILSLISAFQGDSEAAFRLAREGIELGGRLESPFVTAVAHIRLGHAWQLRTGAEGEPRTARDEAISCYQAGITLGDRLAVRRLRAEAMWGLTRAYGFTGDLDTARRTAQEGIETGRWAGDAWITALIETVLGASYVLAGRYDEGIEPLSRSLVIFRDCGDLFGRAATRLWLGLAYAELGQPELFAASIEDSLLLCSANNYGFLYTRPSLLGTPDPRRLVPTLIRARSLRRVGAYAQQLLGELGLGTLQAHPGYRLNVYTLGTFRVLRGDVEVEARDWQRDKARQLLQLLLTRRGHWLQREEIAEQLWPSLSAEAAQRDFKVALNALNRALEPGRPADAPFSYVVREGTAYRLRPEADLWLDATAFEEACVSGLQHNPAQAVVDEAALSHLQAALKLYAGNYLPDTLYEDWASAERERLLSLYLRAADRLTGGLVERGRYDEALEICARILEHDPCWERAYRWMMLAYARRDDRSQALRVYARCAATMRDELGVEPSPATTALYEQIARSAELPAVIV